MRKSVAYNGITALSFETTYPRFIHSEMLRHRALSHCVASSRAIPSHKMRETVNKNPVIPLEWSAKAKGMGTNVSLYGTAENEAYHSWRESAISACDFHEELDSIGLNKQYVNRIIEPYSWVTDVITGTDYTSAFMLRSPLYKEHTDPEVTAQNLVEEQTHMSLDYAKHLVKNTDPMAAQPEIRKIFDMMFEAAQNAPAVQCHYNSTRIHLPYIIADDYCIEDSHEKLNKESHDISLISSARCGRVSYLNQGELRPHQEDIDWAVRANNMGHMSVFDHVLFPQYDDPAFFDVDPSHGRYANLRGFKSLRYRIEEGSFVVNAN